jgi:hypothetical protein
MLKYRPYSCATTSAATFEAPNRECVDWSIENVSGMPCSKAGSS